MGIFLKPAMSRAMPGMAGMASSPSTFMDRIGYGVEMIGALGDGERFGLDRSEQQHYIGPVFMVDFSPRWSVRVEPAFRLSKVSDPFMLRAGVSHTFGGRSKGAARSQM